MKENDEILTLLLHCRMKALIGVFPGLKEVILVLEWILNMRNQHLHCKHLLDMLFPD